MDQFVPTDRYSPYWFFSAERWAEFRADTPLTLTADEVARLSSLYDPIDLDEVGRIYLSLSRLLSAHVEASLSGCDALVLECNHDLEMLAHGDYPYSLKQRIAGRLGHLHNEAAAAILSRIDTSHLSHIVAAHLSRDNNTPELARGALASALGCTQDWIGVADQASGFGWRERTWMK